MDSMTIVYETKRVKQWFVVVMSFSMRLRSLSSFPTALCKLRQDYEFFPHSPYLVARVLLPRDIARSAPARNEISVRDGGHVRVCEECSQRPRSVLLQTNALWRFSPVASAGTVVAGSRKFKAVYKQAVSLEQKTVVELNALVDILCPGSPS